MSDAESVRSTTWCDDAVRIEWPDGTATEYPSLWLRDNCPEDRDAGSGQRLVDIADLPARPLIRHAAARGGQLVIEWTGEERAAVFDTGWLRTHAPGRGNRPPELEVRRWLEGDTLDPVRDVAWFEFAKLATDPAGRLVFMTRLVQQGIAFMSGVPCRERALLAAVAPLGLVADTNYGRVFDVRSVPQPENLAYSDLGLGLHTDNPYRDPVPGFQALHCLVASPEGGDSLFADGFALAEHLRQRDPGAFARLTGTAVTFRYGSKDAELVSEKPLIELDVAGAVRAVHYNNRSIAPLSLPDRELADFYAAYRQFARLLREERFQLRTRLRDGDMAVFDNRRILHGRTAFTSAHHPRHLQGCYLTRDSVLSATALLRRQQGVSS